MLLNTFQHLSGISGKKELELWRSGVITWKDFERSQNYQLALLTSDDSENSPLYLSQKALKEEDADFFVRRLVPQEYYRIALNLHKHTMFLDIETTGLSKYYDSITLIGWSIGREYGVLIQGDSDKAFREAIAKAKTIVTFNGSLFDLPFMRNKIKDLNLPACHVDFRFLAKRVGLSGGQKAIEKEIGLRRSKDLENIEGKTAALLWYKYRWGDQGALKQLISYNHADIEGMKVILDKVVERLLKKMQAPTRIRSVHKFSKSKSTIRWSSGKTNLKEGIKVRSFKGQPGPLITLKDLSVISDNRNLRAVGIDLTGSEARPSGWCILDYDTAITRCLSTDEEIIQETIAVKPDVVSIDSPLSIPEGRTTVSDDDPGRKKYGIMRYCERQLKRRGVNVYPSLIPSMQKLTARGIRLAHRFRSLGIPVIESYPGAAQDIMGIPRKRASLEYLARGLELFGIKGDFTKHQVTHDELDAITSAVVGLFFWSGKYEALGNEAEEYLIIPDLKIDPTNWKNRKVIGLSGPIAAGKTTAGQMLRSQGFHYARYSQVLENILKERGFEPDRYSLQQIGEEINRTLGQRWLGKKLLESLPKSGNIVIDGLRHPEDHAFMVEAFGPAFLHIRIDSSNDVRQHRYLTERGNDNEYLTAIQHPVEANVSELASLAHIVIRNVSKIEPYEMEIKRAIDLAGSKSRGEYHACL